MSAICPLTLLLRNRGGMKEAESMVRRALVAREKALPLNQPDTLTSVNNLASS